MVPPDLCDPLRDTCTANIVCLGLYTFDVLHSRPAFLQKEANIHPNKQTLLTFVNRCGYFYYCPHLLNRWCALLLYLLIDCCLYLLCCIHLQRMARLGSSHNLLKAIALSLCVIRPHRSSSSAVTQRQTGLLLLIMMSPSSC